VLRTVKANLLEGGLLVVAVLFLFLGSLKGGLLVASAIPLSMLFAFIGMYYAGISGNLEPGRHRLRPDCGWFCSDGRKHPPKEI
jgi:AcrB/AcrD/AcrF family protein